jgi:hypothetical protein
MKGIDAQLKKIEKIAADIEKEEEHEQFTKYRKIFDDAIAYIKTKRVLLYGGTAINDLLPAKDKIYGAEVLPDIDIFSENGKKQADDIVKHFIKKGYPSETTTYSEALHENTYKVYIDSLQVFDVTTISKRSFKRLTENSVRGASGIKVVNPQFLRLSLHMMMSQSHDARRWEKVFKRLVTFYKYYPPKECASKKALPAKYKTTAPGNVAESFSEVNYVPDEIIQNIYKFLEDKDCVLFGIHEILEFLKNYSGKAYLPANSKIAPIQILTESNILETAHNLVKFLNVSSLSISQVYPKDEFISEHIHIKYRNHPCVEIYSAPICMTYVTHNKQKIASIHTIIRMYLSMVLSTYDHFETENHSLECLVNILSIIQQKMSGSRKAIYKQLIEQCYGPYQGLVTLRRERVLRGKK